MKLIEIDADTYDARWESAAKELSEVFGSEIRRAQFTQACSLLREVDLEVDLIDQFAREAQILFVLLDNEWKLSRAVITEIERGRRNALNTLFVFLRRCKDNIKSLTKPLYLNPESLHPSEC